MAYNYLELVNDVNKKMNEVVLTSANFASSIGFYDDVKIGVNWAIDEINQQAFEWPFNVVRKELVLTVDQSRYDYEANAKSVAFNTFRIKGETALNIKTTPLWPLDYEDYLRESSDMENNPTLYHKVPTVVSRTTGSQFLVAPAPDRAYTLQYEYYSLPSRLEDWDDVPTVPEFFRNVIYSGSLQQAFDFRGDLEQAERHKQLFEKGIERMRTIYINRTDYASSTMRH